MKNQDWHSLSTAEANPQGENRNTARMANRIISNVEVKTIGQTIVLNSARSSKVNCTPNLKMKNQKKNTMVTRLSSHKKPYIKSIATQIKKTVMMSTANAK